ncbi:21990_t:CDS:1 [Dentiscutata erythropus]|uniref:21990_t:CDS:1 n=1 Tax=Dentiscutata erythropus TaxID=1348616 RepID=A0A9N9J4U5_9GLOM|nr:21990_t:CDS:1 [Dentiscutata erythropus]
MAATYIPSSPSHSYTKECYSFSDSEDDCQQDYNDQSPSRKSVQFSRFLVVHETWCNDEYDRTSTEPARLNFKEYSELLQLRCDLRREMEKMMKAAAVEQSATNNHQQNQE